MSHETTRVRKNPTSAIRNKFSPGVITLMLILAAALILGVTTSPTPSTAQSPRGTIDHLSLSSPSPGELVINWDVPSEVPTDYRVIYAPSDQGYLSWRDENTAEKGNAYPTVKQPHGGEPASRHRVQGPGAGALQRRQPAQRPMVRRRPPSRSRVPPSRLPNRRPSRTVRHPSPMTSETLIPRTENATCRHHGR